MSTASPAAIERFFSKRDFRSGAALRSTIYFCLAALLLGVQILILFLIVDLLHHAGSQRITAATVDAFVSFVGESELTTEESPIGQLLAAAEADPESPPSPVLLQDQGILPAVWWARKTVWGMPLRLLYQRVPPLRSNQTAFLTLVLAAVVVGAVRGLAFSRGQRLSSAVGLELGTRLRQSIHRQRLRLGPSDVDDSTDQQVQDLFKNDVDQIIDGLDQWIQRRIHDPLVIGLLLAVSISLHWRVALQTLIPLAFCWYLIDRLEQRNRKSARLTGDRAEQELKLLAESLRKTRLVRGYGMEEFEQQQFELHAQRFRDNIRKLMRQGNWTARVERLAVVASVSVVLYLLGVKVLIDADQPASLSLSAMLAMVAAFTATVGPLKRLQALPAVQSKVNQSADRIGRYMQQIPEVGQAVGAKFLEPLARSLQFEAVHYAMPGHPPLLQGLDLRVNAGEVVALVSIDPLQSRAVAYMLPRFIEPRQGRVLIDGEDVAWVTLESLRAETIYVGGADPFFTGTVLENILCGQASYSQQDATEAAKTAHAHNFILRLPQGYETLLGEHGEQLEPGESFRLGLARAALRNPALLVVEEPAETMDDDTKSMVDDAYSRMFPGRTVILLPTRLSTLKRADRIFVLHNGRVEAVGKHTELVRSSELYRHWEYVNFNEFARSARNAE